MPKFLLLPRDDGTGFLALTPTEMQAAIAKYMAWSDALRASGTLQLGEKLRDGEGRVVTRGADGLIVTDGPFCEAREMIGGLWILDVADYAAAVAAVQDCPHLHFGSIEIRQVEDLTG